MAVYNLDDWNYLFIDIKAILNRLSERFDIQKNLTGSITVSSKIVLEDKVYWASKESTETFNFDVPDIKNLHGEMYRLVETLFKVLYPSHAKQFKTILESKYPRI